jgi:hypothetical protein
LDGPAPNTHRSNAESVRLFEAIVKGTPRSWMLRWANAAVGWWTSVAVSAIQRQQRAMLGAVKPKRMRTRKRRRGK